MKHFGRYIAILLLAVLCIGLTGTGTVSADELKEAKDEKSKLEVRKKNAEATLRELELQKSDIINYIEQVDKKQQEIEEQLVYLDLETENAELDLEETKEELEEAKNEVNKQYDIMKQRIKYMYENGNAEYIEVLLDSRSMADFLNQTEYMSKIAEYDNVLLKRFETAREAVEKKEQQIEDKLSRLAVLKEETEVEKQTNEALAAEKAEQVAKVEKLLEEADETVSKYQKSIDDQEAKISAIEAEIKRKEEEAAKAAADAAARAAKAARDAAGKAVLEGGFIWPAPDSGRITSGFGYRNEVIKGKGSEFHQGIDIGVAKGSDIIAAAAGTVVAATYHWSMGNYVMIYHGNDVYTIYMHSSKLLVSEGDEVEQGEVIALVGSTGQSTGPHLHFGIKVDGSYVNPLNYVSY